ncbi:MAG: 4-(cytidine 5'-diphospho)-2-C-methyl-D-erythritol kinase [Pseudomonadota bacterium]
MTTVEVFAPAKINLTLHVTGQRDDGYHLLDSLVTFATVGDVIRVTPAEAIRLTLTGPEAQHVPTGVDNLVVRAAHLFGDAFDIVLEKNLPVAAGVGGGSADAAAVLKAISKAMNSPLPSPAEQLALGADVPVCVMGGLVRMRGIGEVLEPIDRAPVGWPMVLVNPRVPASTPAVFEALPRKDNTPMADPYELGPVPHHRDEFIDWLARQRNDLETPAKALVPVIGEVLAALNGQTGCCLARMSGSGATCFGLFADDDDARAAAHALTKAYPEWWVVPSTGSGF